MSGLKLRDVARGQLSKMAAKPMTPFEQQDLTKRSDLPPRASLAPNERWSPIVFVNNRYSVQLSFVDTAVGLVHHLWIRHHAGEMPRSWRDMQRIKNECAGRECVAVEVFPSESELVDSANMAHLWVYPSTFVMPFRLQ